MKSKPDQNIGQYLSRIEGRYVVGKKRSCYCHGSLAVPGDAPNALVIDLNNMKNVTLTEESDGLKIEGEDFSVFIDTYSGVITSYKVKGKELFVQGPVLNLWRAALNNDLSVDLGWRVANEGMQVTSLESAVENSGKTAVIMSNNLPMGRNLKQLLTTLYMEMAI